MKSPIITSGQAAKAGAGFFGGVNSNRLPWILPDTEYAWGENTVNRGGVVQTRPGNKVSLTIPGVNPQGCILMRINNPNDTTFATTGEARSVMVLAIDGKIYAVPYPWITPANLDFSPWRVPNLSFNPNAAQIVFCLAKKQASTSPSGDIVITPRYNVLMIQDGSSAAGYYDGVNSGQLDETAPALQTPRGLWMAWSGDRLWVGRGSTVLAGDIGDPLSFKERTQSGLGYAGDFQYDEDITGLSNSQGQSNQSALIIFTRDSTSSIQSQITDRTQWKSVTTFQQVIYPTLGCVAGKSITNSTGLLYWYSNSGLVSSDSAARYYLTSQINYKDVKMARCKRNLNPDLSGICTSSFENYLMVSVPYGDVYNANTMVLDAVELPETGATQINSWQGVWTGFRPVEWTADYLSGQYRIFFLSLDYQSSNGSFIHLWEAFTPERYDQYEYTDSNGVLQLARNRIYCSYESKAYGDLMDLKKFKYTEVDVMELGGTVDVKVSYAGQIGSYKPILQQTLNAQIDGTGLTNSQAITLASRQQLRKQYRRLRTENAVSDNPRTVFEVESPKQENIDKFFSVLIQWCGQMAIQSLRLMMNEFAETSQGQPSINETTVNMVTIDGTPFKFDQATLPLTDQNPQTPSGSLGTLGFTPNALAFLNAFTQRYRDVFYSSIPVTWQDLPQTEITNLPCCRDNFSPPTRPPILIEGAYVG